MYKKTKKNPLEEPSHKESSKEQTTLVLIGPHATFPRIEEIFSSFHVSSVTQDPLESTQAGELAHTITKPNIFSRYREIKKKNEALKVTTYSEF